MSWEAPSSCSGIHRQHHHLPPILLGHAGKTGLSEIKGGSWWVLTRRHRCRRCLGILKRSGWVTPCGRRPRPRAESPQSRQLPRRQLGGRDSCYVQGHWDLQGWSQRLIPRLQPALAGDGTCAGLLSEAGASPELLMVAQALQGSSGWLATLSRCRNRPRLGYSFPSLTPSPRVASERLLLPSRSPVSAPKGRGGKRTQALGQTQQSACCFPGLSRGPWQRALPPGFSLSLPGSGARGCHRPSEMLAEGGKVRIRAPSPDGPAGAHGACHSGSSSRTAPPHRAAPRAPPTPATLGKGRLASSVAPGFVFLL